MTTNEARDAIVLLSGGMDSATVLAIARDQGFACHALSFDYGQRHDAELGAATRLAADMGAASHRVIRLDPVAHGGSALTDPGIEVPDADRPGAGEEIPVTYVPARNTVFLAHALGVAEVVGALDLFIGVNAIDYSGYPDCRPEFIAAFETVANLGTRCGTEGRRMRVHAPLQHRSKAEIVRLGLDLGVRFEDTVSCYRADSRGRACGRCDACALRREGFRAAGVEDPTHYFASHGSSRPRA